MAERPEDLGLPQTIVSRIINEALPPHTNVSAEARRVIGKTASVFVLYVTATSASLAAKSGRKTMSGTDVLGAIEEMEFGQFAGALEKSLENFRDQQKVKKAKKSAAAAATPEPDPGNSPGKSGKKSSPGGKK